MRTYAIRARLFAGLTLILAWGLTNSPLLGVAFVLLLTALSAARYRIKSVKFLSAAEIAACLIYAFFWIPALLGLWLPLIGFLENKWSGRERELLKMDYDDRAERLRLERERARAALEARNAAHIAEINERSRIAQELHDHVGHEVTGALIALQTAAKLYEDGDRRAGELLNQTVARLESASANLRDTVHNLKPAKASGLAALEELCEGFTFCEVDFKASGDLEGIRGDILAANLKEALTNVSRHSNATLVEVRLDGNADYVRMSVTDNGNGSQKTTKPGLGINGMKERVRMAGGTLTINTNNGFQIICVLPKGAKT